VTDRPFSPSTLVSSTNKTDCHDIAEILLKVALNTIKPTNQSKVGCLVTNTNLDFISLLPQNELAFYKNLTIGIFSK
jgi:hypothetical protein